MFSGRLNNLKILGSLVTKTILSSNELPQVSSPLVAEALARSISPAPSSVIGVDYQVNVSSTLAKALSLSPNEVAMKLATSLMLSQKEHVNAISSPLFVHTSAGKNGFVNFTLSDTWLFSTATANIRQQTNGNKQDGIDRKVKEVKDKTEVDKNIKFNIQHGDNLYKQVYRILVDFASPNVGKELHVGHLRSGVIGDSLSRILEYAPRDNSDGNNLEECHSEVVRVSHVGDCGLPASLVLTEEENKYNDGINKEKDDALSNDSLPLPTPAELSRWYELAKKRSANDKIFANKTQVTVRMLQRGLATAGTQLLPDHRGAPSPLDIKNEKVFALGKEYSRLLKRWQRLCEASRAGYLPLFKKLGVNVEERPESLYAPMLEEVVNELLQSGHAVEQNGAVGLFVDGPSNPPFLIRKSDGGYLYATIDLACLRVRLRAGFNRIVYVTDHAQNGHFQLLFKAARYIGWVGTKNENNLAPFTDHDQRVSTVSLEHASFGLVTGEGGKKLSSRDGSASEATLQGLLENGADVARQSMQQLQAAASAHQTERADKFSGSSVSRSPIPSSVLLPLSGIEATQASERISSSAIRFFDLSHKRSSNYAFSPERAMSLKGQSAPYILYAITRLNTLRLQAAAVLGVDVTEAQVDDIKLIDDTTTHKSILDVDKSLKKVSSVWEKLAIECEERICVSKDFSNDKSLHEFTLHSAERTLALSLTRLPEAVASAARLLYPHILAEHVLELAAATHVCYDACRVLPPTDAQAEQDWRLSARRLRLLGAADADIRLCCHLLGVEVVTRM